jgi:hypothetical protein
VPSTGVSYFTFVQGYDWHIEQERVDRGSKFQAYYFASQNKVEPWCPPALHRIERKSYFCSVLAIQAAHEVQQLNA